MAATQQQTQPLRERIWQAVRELHVITAFFTWLFLLASRLAEPLMTISSIYVIVEAGIPSASIALVHDLALGIMISAPEIILPGAFILAARESRQGNEQAWVIKVMCWAFVALTAATLGTLFLWKDAPAWVIDLVMWLRCVVSIGYSILIRVLNHSQEDALQRGQSQRAQDQVTELVNQFREELQGVRSQIDQEVQQVVQSEVQREVQMIHTEVQKAIEHLPQQVQRALRNRLNLLREQRAAYPLPTGSAQHDQKVHSTPAVNPGCESPKGSTESTVNLSSEQGEPGVRVQRFITEQLARGHTPTLREIMDACQCSKNTAIRHRRTLIGNGDEQAQASPTLTVVRAL